MARPRTDNRNELKTRVNDRVYEGVQRYIESNQGVSEARAISNLLELALFGMVGSVPEDLVSFRPEMGHFGTKTRA